VTINSSSWKSFPVAPRETPYDYDDAVARMLEWADGDTKKFAKGFLWTDPNAEPGSPDAYRLPIVDVMENRLVMIPRAVFSAATILSGAHGGLEDVTTEDERLELKSVVTDIYDALREEYRDPRVKPPWLRGGNEESKVTAAMEEEYLDALLASVNSAGWASMPVADDDRAWNSGQAKARVWEWAGGNFAKYRRAFLWWDASAPDLKGSYKLPIADVIDGQLTIVPHAVNAVAAVLGGARGGVSIPDADMDSVERVVNRIQTRVRGEDAVEACGGEQGPLVEETLRQVFGCGECEGSDCVLTDDDVQACGDCGEKRKLKAIEAAWIAPAAAVFQPPRVDGPTPLTITADGRIYGHAWLWNKCHAGIQNECVMAPRNRSGYKYFMNGQVLTADGSMVRVGKITMGTGHAGPRTGWQPAAAHYDNTGTQAAYVTITEDEWGGMLAGVPAPGMDEDQLAKLRVSPVSGDWRRVGDGPLELVAALAVNTPGFPIVASLDTGEVECIQAAGVLMPDGTELHRVDEELTDDESSLVARVDALDDRISALMQKRRGRILDKLNRKGM
jgi:hypothetical protein